MKKSDKAKNKNIKNYKKKNEALNKKHSNNKVLKAKEILEKNKTTAPDPADQELEQELEQEIQVSKAAKVFTVIKNVFCWGVIAALAFTLLSFLVVRINGGTPALFGYSIQRVSSGSMEPELMVGDIILSKNVSSPDEVKKDDIITFKGGKEYEFNNVTHRVITAPIDAGNGEYTLITKGDANEVADSEISFDSVNSKMIRKVEILNKFYEFFLSPWGLIIFVGALLIIFFDELLNVVKILTGNYRDEDDENIAEIITRLKREEEAERIRKEKEQEKKRKRREKSDNKSKKKKKKQKKLDASKKQSEAKKDSKNEQ